MDFQKCILSPIFNNDVPTLYPRCQHTDELRYEKTSSHIFKYTVEFLEKRKQKIIRLSHLYMQVLRCVFQRNSTLKYTTEFKI